MFCFLSSKDLTGSPQDISKLIADTICDVMCDTLIGCDSYDDDKELHEFLYDVVTGAKIMGTRRMAIVNYIPFSRNFLKGTERALLEQWRKESTFLLRRINEHQTTRKADEPRDLIDSYLAKIDEDPDVFTLEELLYILIDLWFASVETTSNTLIFGLLYMIVNPEVQANVHKELIEVHI